MVIITSLSTTATFFRVAKGEFLSRITPIFIMEKQNKYYPIIIILIGGNQSWCHNYLFLTHAAQAHYSKADVTLACEQCCVTNGYLQRLVWDVNGFS